MATSTKIVAMRPKSPGEKSPLTPELKEFIDRAIVPALVKQCLAEIDLAKRDSDTANSGRHTAAPELRTMRP